MLLTTLPLNSSAQLNHIKIVSFRADYITHAIIFIPWAFFSSIGKVSRIYWLAIGLLFAVCTEGIQYLLPYRAYNINDLIANAIGIIVGYIATFHYFNTNS